MYSILTLLTNVCLTQLTRSYTKQLVPSIYSVLALSTNVCLTQLITRYTKQIVPSIYSILTLSTNVCSTQPKPTGELVVHPTYGTFDGVHDVRVTQLIQSSKETPPNGSTIFHSRRPGCQLAPQIWQAGNTPTPSPNVRCSSLHRFTSSSPRLEWHLTTTVPVTTPHKRHHTLSLISPITLSLPIKGRQPRRTVQHFRIATEMEIKENTKRGAAMRHGSAPPPLKTPPRASGLPRVH